MLKETNLVVSCKIVQLRQMCRHQLFSVKLRVGSWFGASFWHAEGPCVVSVFTFLVLKMPLPDNDQFNIEFIQVVEELSVLYNNFKTYSNKN